MKRKRIAALLIVCTVVGIAPLASTWAGNFTIQGGLTSMACLPSLAHAADAGDGTLALGQLALGALPAIGSTADAGRFSIALGACGLSPHTVVSAWFYNVAAGAISHGRLNRASGGGAGWQYQFLPGDAGNAQLDVGISPTVAVSPIHLNVDAPTDASLAYRVRYYRSSTTLIAGDIISHATYVLYHH